MAIDAEGIRTAEERVAKLQSELGVVQTSLHQAELLVEAGEKALTKVRRILAGALGFTVLTWAWLVAERRQRSE